MATIIDSLVVTLGLDASNYKKGRETAQKETTETARVAKQAADQITKSLTEVGRTIAGLFLGFESASGFVKFLGNINSGEAALGRTARAIGMNVHELNKWGNAIELAGGNAGELQAAFSKLTQDAVAFKTTGQSSDLINLLRNRGVEIFDQNGKLRNQGEILEELADKTEKYGAAYQEAIFSQVGLSEGLRHHLEETHAQRVQDLADAEKNNSVTDDSVKKAQELQKYWREIGQAIQEAGQKILYAVTPYVKEAFQWTEKMFAQFKETGGLQAVANTLATIANIITTSVHGLSMLADLIDNSSLGPYLRAAGKRAFDFYASTAQAGADPAASDKIAEKVADVFTSRNNNPGNIKAVGNQPRDSRGFRIFTTEEEGLHALGAQVKRSLKRGGNTISGFVNSYEGADAPGNHNDIPAYISTLMDFVGKKADDQLTDADLGKVIAGVLRQEGNIRRDISFGPTPGIVGKTAGGAAQGGGSTTTVSVQTINVNAPNADPAAVAQQIPVAIQRKFTSTQADRGQN